MRSPLRTSVIVSTLAAAAVLLSGCSLLGLGALERGADGQVLESTVINSADLLAGDCFSSIGDGTDLTKVTAIPCAEEHTSIVLAGGELTAEQVEAAGGLQNAVSVACDEPFTTFKTAVVENGLKTKQQFFVSKKTVEEIEVQAYSCVALDPKAPDEEPTEGETDEAGGAETTD